MRREGIKDGKRETKGQHNRVKERETKGDECKTEQRKAEAI